VSDDICGYPTADGSPCQNPAGENGRCWIPSHNPGDDDANPQGRDFKIDESDHDDILEAARMGASKAGCARAAGVDKASLLRYLDAHDQFRTAFMRARHEGERTLVKGPLISDDHNKGPDGVEIDGQHARFLLSTSFDYVKTERQEVEHAGDGGGPVEFVLNRQVVTDGDGD